MPNLRQSQIVNNLLTKLYSKTTITNNASTTSSRNLNKNITTIAKNGIGITSTTSSINLNKNITTASKVLSLSGHKNHQFITSYTPPLPESAGWWQFETPAALTSISNMLIQTGSDENIIDWGDSTTTILLPNTNNNLNHTY